MKWIALVVVAMLVVPSLATADTLWRQDFNTGTNNGHMSQDFPDVPDQSTWSFDDFTVLAPGWVVDKVTINGVEQGDPALDQNVLLRLYSAPDVAAPASPLFAGTQIGPDLVFNLPDVPVAAGTWWVSAWVQRPSTTGQWYWGTSTPVQGSEHWIQNPSGDIGYGTEPNPGKVWFVVPSDLAFTIEGPGDGPPNATPELPPLALLSALPFGLAWLRRRAKP